MKKILFLSIIFLTFITPVWGLELNIESKNAILYNLDEDKILYEKNSEEKIAIASMTKIMTAIVSLENISSLDQRVMLTSQDFVGLVEANASVAGFKVNQMVTYRDLLYGLLLPSGADAAQALVRNIAGSKVEFVKLMNDKAQEIGLTNTHFNNETGLDSNGAYSTVYDVAKMFKYALQNEDFKKIISTKKYTTSDKSLTFTSTVDTAIKNSNLNLDYIIGGKTGTTKNAGKCLASLANYDNVNFILVTARASSANIKDASIVYDYFKDNYDLQNVINKNELILELDCEKATKEKLQFLSTEDIIKYLPNDFKKEDLVYNYNGLKVITPKIKKGEKLGSLEIKYQDEVLASVDIYLNEEVKYDYFKVLATYKVEIVAGLVIISLTFIIIKKKHKRKRKIKRF